MNYIERLFDFVKYLHISEVINMQENSFVQEDYRLAQESFSKWQKENYETIDQYVLRKRKAQLRALVKKVIENELSEYEQELVDLHWYKNISKEEIAKSFNVNRTTIYRHFDKINNVIFEKLKYALEYRFGVEDDDAFKLIVASKQLCKTHNNQDEIADRVISLRTAQFWDLKTLSYIADIGIQRLNRLENKEEFFTLDDIKKLSKIFDVSTDFLIFGNS